VPERAWGFESPLPHEIFSIVAKLSSKYERVFCATAQLKPILKPIRCDRIRQPRLGDATEGPSPARSSPSLHKTQGDSQPGSDIDWASVLRGDSDPHLAADPNCPPNFRNAHYSQCVSLILADDPWTQRVAASWFQDGVRPPDMPQLWLGYAMLDQVTYGDIAGDGQTYAAVPLDSGGAAGVNGVLIFRLAGVTPQLLDVVSGFGLAMFIQPDAGALYVLGRGNPNEPTCCPSTIIRSSHRLEADNLVEYARCAYTPSSADWRVPQGTCAPRPVPPSTRSAPVASAAAQPEPTAQAQPGADQGWTLFAGGSDRSGSQPGQFSGVMGAAVDTEGNVYVIDPGNARIQKFSPDGVPLAQIGSFDGRSSLTRGIGAVATDPQGNLYVLEGTFGDRVQKFSPQGQLIAEWGAPPPPRTGPPEMGGYQDPRSVAVDSQGNLYYVVSSPQDGPRIRKVSAQGTPIALLGSTGEGPGQFRYPTGLAVDSSDNLYVVDYINRSVQKFAPDGTALALWRLPTDDTVTPVGVAVDGASNVYVAARGVLIKLSPEGQVLATWRAGESGAPTGRFGLATGVAVDRTGNIYVVQDGESRVMKLPASAAQQASTAESAASSETAQSRDVAPLADSTSSGSDHPEVHTESVRAEILSAVDRANAAWAAATESLDPAALDGAVAGDELSADLAELDKLRAQGQRRRNVNTAFSVVDITLDGPARATVRTRETWYAEVFDVANGRLLQRTSAATYAETYTLENRDGAWIVIKIDL